MEFVYNQNFDKYNTVENVLLVTYQVQFGATQAGIMSIWLIRTRLTKSRMVSLPTIDGKQLLFNH